MTAATQGKKPKRKSRRKLIASRTVADEFTGLNIRQQDFPDHFCRVWNASEAARLCGYSPKSAGSQGAALLRNPRIAAIINAKMALMRERYAADNERLIQEMRFVAMSNMADYIRIDQNGDVVFDFSQCTREQLAAVEAIQIEEHWEGTGKNARLVKRYKLKLYNKPQAAFDLLRQQGMFDDDPHRRVPAGVVFEMVIPDDRKRIEHSNGSGAPGNGAMVDITPSATNGSGANGHGDPSDTSGSPGSVPPPVGVPPAK